jgi:hypothetical protein
MIRSPNPENDYLAGNVVGTMTRPPSVIAAMVIGSDLHNRQHELDGGVGGHRFRVAVPLARCHGDQHQVEIGIGDA